MIGACAVEGTHEQIIGDKAYDNDPLDAEGNALGVAMIAAQRAGRCKTQDGRALRRDASRWKVARLFAWLQNCHRLITRCERKSENFLVFLRLAAFMILARSIYEMSSIHWTRRPLVPSGPRFSQGCFLHFANLTTTVNNFSSPRLDVKPGSGTFPPTNIMYVALLYWVPC